MNFIIENFIFQMGADFYPFIIDNNGLVVLHPDLIEVFSAEV